MPEQRRSVLVLLSEEAPSQSLRQLRAQYRVTEEAPPRLIVVAADRGDIEQLRTAPGIVAVIEDAIPTNVLESLSEAERLYADAWEARRQMGKKRRPGDGLSWDAEGFEPPDMPPEP